MCASGRHFQTNETAEQGGAELLPERDLRRIVDTVLRLAKSTVAEKPKSMSTKSLTH